LKVDESKDNYWVKSGLFSLFEKGAAFIFGFGTTIVLLRHLTPNEFGIWALFLATSSFIEVGLIGLVQNGLVRYLSTAKDKKEYDTILNASLLLNIILSVLSAITLLIFAELMSEWLKTPELKVMLQLYAVVIILLIPFYHGVFIQQANLSFSGIFWSNLARKGLFFVIVLLYFFASWEQNVIQLIYMQMAATLLGSMVAWWAARSFLSTSGSISMVWVKKLFHYGRFVFGTNLSTMLFKTIDKFMLGGILSTAAVGMYELAIRITNLIDVPAFSVAAVVFPQGARQSRDGTTGDLKALYEKSVGTILAIILPFIVGVLLFPKIIVLLIAGEKYLESVPLLRLTILYGLFLPYAVQFGTVLDSMGKPKINFYLTLLGTMVNVVFNYVFIHQFGIYGAAYGTLCTYVITFVIYQTVLKRMLDVDMLAPFRYIPGFYQQAYGIFKAKFFKSTLAEKRG
jgi:O-antigen/teichoic acid export membrane protein